ncbi:retrovirus-related pol polyprotein from transposon TNT 1-94 [Tanacetum coccineum]
MAFKVLEKDSEVSKGKKEKYKSLALKARKVSSDEEVSCSDSDNEEYVMAVRDFKKFFRRRGKFFHQPHYDKKNFRKIKEDKKEKEDRRCFKCRDPNHFISDCPKHSYNDQKAFVVGCWSDSEEDFKKDEICLMALDNNEVLSDTPYYSSSSLDSESLQNEYNKLCKISLRIINKNKHLKAKNELLKNEACAYKKRLDQLERNKETSIECETCAELRSKDYLTKFDPKSTKDIFLGYSPNSKAYTILDKETMMIKESLNMRFDESPPPNSSPLVDDDIIESQIIENQIKDIEIKENKPLNKEIVNIKESKDHPIDSVIEYLTKFDPKSTEGVFLGYSHNSKAYIILNKETMRIEESLNVRFDESPPPKSSPLVDDEPKNVKEVIQDESWTMAMQEELNQFKINVVWSLVPSLDNQTIIGTKWVFKNKLDENEVVSRNKARLVTQEYNQQEEIDFDETYAPISRLESIRILLAYDCAHDFKIFQMDVKSAFLNGFINEEVYVAQPPDFVDFEKPNHVFKLIKALYGLKQAPKAWYDRLKAFLLDHMYTIGW